MNMCVSVAARQTHQEVYFIFSLDRNYKGWSIKIQQPTGFFIRKQNKTKKKSFLRHQRVSNADYYSAG